MQTKKTVQEHILQSAGLGTKELKLRIITFNLGDNKKTEKQWLEELSTWNELNRFDYDLLSRRHGFY